MFARIVENRFRKGRVSVPIALRIWWHRELLGGQCDQRFWMFPFHRIQEWEGGRQSPSSET